MIESIRIYGIDVTYVPRVLTNVDDVFSEDASSRYETPYTIEMYVKNVEGFEGEGDLLSKFNIQIRDEITFTVAQRVFHETIGVHESPATLLRPKEGDIIYFPLTTKLYVIKHVEHEPTFYQMGSLQMYDLRCELFEYSNEELATGIPEIDDYETEYSTNVLLSNTVSYYANGDVIIDANTGRPLGVDTDNTEFDDNIIDFSVTNPFEENLS